MAATTSKTARSAQSTQPTRPRRKAGTRVPSTRKAGGKGKAAPVVAAPSAVVAADEPAAARGTSSRAPGPTKRKGRGRQAEPVKALAPGDRPELDTEALAGEEEAVLAAPEEPLDAEPLMLEDEVEAEEELAPEIDAAEDESARPRNENTAQEPSSFLAMYFRDMAALDVLKPEEEFRAAREIEALELRVWQAILSWGPVVDHVLKVVEACMDNSMPEFRVLRRLAAEAGKGTQARLDKAASKCAEKLRALDTDRLYLESVVVELHRFYRDLPGRIVPERLPFEVRSQEFGRYYSRVMQANRAASAARNEFVKANLRLVVSIARRFNHGRMALADLIQEGNIGLMKAVERYDYRRGFRFSTYASWWIRHAISRALADKGREVRLPVHMIDAYHRISKAKRELTAKLGRQPTTEEIAQAANIPALKVEKMRTYLVDQSFSLDRPVNDEDGRHFIEFLQDPETEDESPVDRLTLDTLTGEIRQLLHNLKPIEADILRQRFGLDDDRELTLKEIGEKYNLSRERIRQLQEQALTKMRRALQRKEMM